MGRCIKCKTSTTQTCVGCGDRVSYICQGCQLSCAWCNHEGPYCPECHECQSSGPDECGEPSNNECWGCQEVIEKGDFWTKCYECDEGRYCGDCVSQCGGTNCGNKQIHYLCKNGTAEHYCRGDDNGEPCHKYFCSEWVLYEGSDEIYCDEHVPKFSDRIVKIMLSRNTKLQELNLSHNQLTKIPSEIRASQSNNF